MNEIDRLKERIQKEKDKNKELKKINRENKRKILAKLKELEEDIKNIMYME